MMEMHFLVLVTVLIPLLVFLPTFVYAQEMNPQDELQKLLEGENKRSFLLNEKDTIFSAYFGNKEKLESHGNHILIKSGTNVVLDRSIFLEYGTILVEGTLNIQETGEFPLRVQKIIVAPSGKLIIGTEKLPIEKNKTVKITFFKNQPGEIGIFVFGQLTIHGYDLGLTFTELTSDALPGQEVLAVAPLVKEWKRGSTILITSPGTTNEFQKCLEENEILRIEGPFLHLKKPLECFHQGYNGNDELVSSHVVDLDRNVVIRSEDLKNRGSVNYFHGSEGYVKFGEFKDLGPKNVLGRYPIHFHHMQDTSRGIEVVGNSIINSENRWVTIHDSNGILVQNNVGYKSTGHGFFLEAGTEFDNTFDRNIGIKTMKGNLIDSDNKASVFWTMNPRNSFTNNVAVAGYYYGFHFMIPNVLVEVPDFENKVNLRSLSNLEFDNNISYNYRHAGLTISRPQVVDESIEDQTISVSGFKAWNQMNVNNAQWGIRILGYDIIINNSKIFENPIGIQMQGKNNVVQDTSIKIVNQNNADPLVAGILINGQDMTIKHSVVEGYVSNKLSSPSDILIDNSPTRNLVISGFIIDSTLFDPHPIYFGNPANSKSFLQIFGYDAPNAPKNNYPKNFILQKIDFDDINQDEKLIDLNFVAKITPIEREDYEGLDLSPEIEKSLENLNYEKIQLFKNNAFGWTNQVISDNEFSAEVKIMMEEGFIRISLVDLDNLDAYDLDIPSWMKRTVSFWIRDSISDQEFFNAIEFVLKLELANVFDPYN